MIPVIRGFLSLMQSMFDADFIVVPLSFAVIASLAFIITGMIKERG